MSRFCTSATTRSIRNSGRLPRLWQWATAATVAVLFISKVFESPLDALMAGVFQVVSIGTTTGFTTANYAAWPGAIPVLLLFMSFIGGCAGSTAGGMKVIRWLLIYKQGLREVGRLIHPSAEIPVKLGERAVPHGWWTRCGASSRFTLCCSP